MRSNPRMPFRVEGHKFIYKGEVIGRVGLRDDVPTVQITEPVEIKVDDLKQLKGLAIWIKVMAA